MCLKVNIAKNHRSLSKYLADLYGCKNLARWRNWGA